MSRLISFLLIIFFFSRSTYGMDCNFGNSKNIIDEIVGTCPRPLLDSTDKSYCCIDIKNDKFYCCDAEEFALKTGLGIVVPAIIATVVILLLIISCISCLCCSCCPWYRRRHRGTVYGSKAGNWWPSTDLKCGFARVKTYIATHCSCFSLRTRNSQYCFVTLLSHTPLKHFYHFQIISSSTTVIRVASSFFFINIGHVMAFYIYSFSRSTRSRINANAQ